MSSCSRKRLTQLEKARAQKRIYAHQDIADENFEKPILAPLQIVATLDKTKLKQCYATLVTGLSFTPIQEYNLIMGIDFMPEKDFYTYQQIIQEAINSLIQCKLGAFQSKVIQERKNGKKFVACFDGAYSHPRNANECIMDIIHPVHRKIFAYAVAEKSSLKNKDVQYSDSSKALEVTALKALLLEWKDYDLFSGYCHDLDSSARTLIENLGLDLEEYFDHNHTVKHFNAIFASVLKLYPKALYGIQKKLATHFSICVHANSLSSDEKEDKWRGCYEHFTSSESNWSKKEEEISRKALKVLIEKGSTVFPHILTQARTQMNEAFHSLKGKWASKRISFTNSWITRVQMSIMEFNWPGTWKLELADLLGIEFTEEQRQNLIKLYRTMSIRRKRKKEKKYLQKEKQRRYEKREKNSLADAKSDDYIRTGDAKKEELSDFEHKYTEKKLPVTSPKKPIPDNSIHLIMPNKEDSQHIQRTKPKLSKELKYEVDKVSIMKPTSNIREYGDITTYTSFFYRQKLIHDRIKYGTFSEFEIDLLTYLYVVFDMVGLSSPSFMALCFPGRVGYQIGNAIRTHPERIQESYEKQVSSEKGFNFSSFCLSEAQKNFSYPLLEIGDAIKKDKVLKALSFSPEQIKQHPLPKPIALTSIDISREDTESDEDILDEEWLPEVEYSEDEFTSQEMEESEDELAYFIAE